MKFNKSNTLIVLGKSSILDDETIKDCVNELKTRFHVVGINHSAVLFKTEYMAFCDYGLKVFYDQIHPNTKLITLDVYATEKFRGDYHHIYLYKEGDPPFKETQLAYAGFTHDMVISWACFKGYKNVILIGAADFTGDGTYLKGYEKLMNKKYKFEPGRKYVELSKSYLNSVNGSSINLFTVNPESTLGVKYINIKDI